MKNIHKLIGQWRFKDKSWKMATLQERQAERIPPATSSSSSVPPSFPPSMEMSEAHDAIAFDLGDSFTADWNEDETFQLDQPYVWRARQSLVS